MHDNKYRPLCGHICERQLTVFANNGSRSTRREWRHTTDTHIDKSRKQKIPSIEPWWTPDTHMGFMWLSRGVPGNDPKHVISENIGIGSLRNSDHQWTETVLPCSTGAYIHTTHTDIVKCRSSLALLKKPFLNVAWEVYWKTLFLHLWMHHNKTRHNALIPQVYIWVSVDIGIWN